MADTDPLPAAGLSVVIPAHDEETVIARCLAFLPALAGDGCRVVVVANGCTDATVDVARSVGGGSPDVTVLDTPGRGKATALNDGDAAAGNVFPRVYLDADVIVDADALRLLRDELTATSAPRVAAPRPRFELAGRPWAVRAFYDVFGRLPYAQDDLVGLGVYAVNAAGHARLGRFPDVVADDLFVQRTFAPQERVVVDAEFVVQTPRTLAALVKVRSRVASGNAQLAASSDDDTFAPTTGGTLGALTRLVAARPRSLPAVICYLAVGAAARLRARRGGSDGGGWERDTTTRPAATTERVRLDMLDFDPVTSDGAVDRVVTAMVDGNGGVIVTPNVDIMQQCRDPSVAQLFRRADLVVADGAPVVLASRLAGTPLPGRVTGSGLLPDLTAAAHAAGRSVMLLGGAPGVADAAAGVLRARHPGLRITTYCPPVGFEDDPVQMQALEAAVDNASPDLVCLGLGSPKQERLAHHLAARSPARWFLGCGGALTMVAGMVPRAPQWVQVLGVEWLHRLAKEPRRLARRYLVDDLPYGVGLLVRSAWAGRRRARVARHPA